MPCDSAKVFDGTARVLVGAELLWYERYLVFSPRLSSWATGVSASARRNDVISIAPILVRLQCSRFHALAGSHVL